MGSFGVNIKQKINMNSDLEPLQVSTSPLNNTTTNSRLQSYNRNRNLNRKNSNLLALPILSKKMEKSTVYKQNENLKRSENANSKSGIKPKVRVPQAQEIPPVESSNTLGSKAVYYANDSPIHMRDKYGRRGSSLKKPKIKKGQYRFMIRKQSDDYFSQTPQNDQNKPMEKLDKTALHTKLQSSNYELKMDSSSPRSKQVLVNKESEKLAGMQKQIAAGCSQIQIMDINENEDNFQLV